MKHLLTIVVVLFCMTLFGAWEPINDSDNLSAREISTVNQHSDSDFTAEYKNKRDEAQSEYSKPAENFSQERLQEHYKYLREIDRRH